MKTIYEVRAMIEREELENRINELEKRRFNLSMKDHWSAEDWRIDAKLKSEICKLNKALAVA